MWMAITLCIALIGIAVTWLVVKNKAPRYMLTGTNLVSAAAISNYDGLQISYGSCPVEQATVTYIWFWNAGREPIRATDIAPADPLRIEVEEVGCRILSCNVVASSREVTNGHVKELLSDPFAGEDDAGLSAISFSICFDFLDCGDWIQYQIIHTGASPTDCSLKGTIIGCREGPQATSSRGVHGLAWKIAAMAAGCASVGMFVLIPKFSALPVLSKYDPNLRQMALLAMASFFPLTLMGLTKAYEKWQLRIPIGAAQSEVCRLGRD